MKKLLIFIFLLAIPLTASASSLAGRILLQVEQNGEAFYFHPESLKLHFLGRPDDAFKVMREQGIGISNANLLKIQVADTLALKNTFSGIDSDGDGFDDYTELINDYNPYGEGRLSYDLNFTRAQQGKIFLQVENNGEAWYINPVDNKRYFLGRPADAFEIMRTLGLGISNRDLLALTDGDNSCSLLLNCVKYRNVEIAWELPTDAFKHVIGASGFVATNFDLESNLSIIKKALDKYPEGMLRRYLNRIYIMDKIYLNGVEIFGTMDISSNRIFVLSSEKNQYLEYTIHHELAHILSLRPNTAWQALNMKNEFKSVNEIEYASVNLNNYILFNKLDPQLASLGFLTPYSNVNIEEDIAQMAGFMFDNNYLLLQTDFWQAIDDYPKLRHKFNILLKFYQEKDAIFTEQYFRELSLD